MAELELERRSFDEAVSYILDKIRNMEIQNSEKNALCGMIVALQVLHEKETEPRGKSATQNFIEQLLMSIANS